MVRQYAQVKRHAMTLEHALFSLLFNTVSFVQAGTNLIIESKSATAMWSHTGKATVLLTVGASAEPAIAALPITSKSFFKTWHSLCGSFKIAVQIPSHRKWLNFGIFVCECVCVCEYKQLSSQKFGLSEIARGKSRAVRQDPASADHGYRCTEL